MPLADVAMMPIGLEPSLPKGGAWANIPPRCNREPVRFSPHLYRARNLVERFFNKIKQCRRIATRYDKLAANYLAFVQLQTTVAPRHESTPSAPVVGATPTRRELGDELSWQAPL